MKDKDLLIRNGVDVDKSLELFGDMAMYDETLVEFLEGINGKLSDLKKYKESSDMYNYAIIAHSLKSDCRYLGFTKLAELAYEHEIAGKNNDISSVYNTYDNLVDEAKRIVMIINQYLGNETMVEEVKPNVVSDKVILIADDSDIIRNFVSKCFEGIYCVKYANDGAEAIRAIEEDTNHKISCMMLDLNMPNVNGYKVLDYLKENNLFNIVPVVIITGVDTKDEINKTFSYPIVDVLSKPFNERDVKNVIERVIRN